MKNIDSTLIYKYPKPINFDENDSSFDIFKNIENESCFEPKIEILKNVKIANNSVIFKNFKIFRDSCYNEENYQRHKGDYKFFLKYIFPKFNFSKKRFLVITDEWTNNYYHWHAFALKKLLILKEKNLLENSILFLPKKMAKTKFAMDSLKKFGIKKEQIFFLRRKSHIKVAEVPLINPARQHPRIYQEISKIIIENTSFSDLNFGDKIYLSRAKQVLRFIENEKEVFDLLAKYGFKKIIAEDLSYDEQISIFKKAKYLIAPHGAGLTNVLFMPAGSCVLEMAAPIILQDSTRYFNKDFFALSSMVGLKYFYQECKIGPKSQVADFHHGSLVVDLEILEKNLKLMIECQTS